MNDGKRSSKRLMKAIAKGCGGEVKNLIELCIPFWECLFGLQHQLRRERAQKKPDYRVSIFMIRSMCKAHALALRSVYNTIFENLHRGTVSYSRMEILSARLDKAYVELFKQKGL
jgi:hypothetical protein